MNIIIVLQENYLENNKCVIPNKHSAWFVEGNNLSVLAFVLGTQKKRYSFPAPVEQKPYQINVFSE